MATEEKEGSLWAWLRDETNRKVIAWFGSGVIVVASGLWVAYEKFDPIGKKSAPPVPTSSVTVQGAGVVAGRDVNQGTIINKGAENSDAGPKTSSSSSVVIGGDGVVGGRDVNTGTVLFRD